MSELAEIITGEFADAVEVKNPESLKRGIFLLLSSSVPREEHKTEHDGLKESITALNTNVQLIASRMEEGFKRIDERFEASNRRFESMNERFESMNERFESMNERFESMNERFKAIDKRFESMDKRFESMQQQIDRRFDAVDKKFSRQTTLMTIGFLAVTTLITVYRFLG